MFGLFQTSLNIPVVSDKLKTCLLKLPIQSHALVKKVEWFVDQITYQ